MGKAHTAAYKNVPLIFGNEPAIPVLHTVADINLQSAEETYKYGGFKYFTNDWKKIVENPEIDVIDIVTPNAVHPEIAIAAAENGKHVYCEKPLANTAKESEPMMKVAEKNNIVSLVGFNYLKIPVIEYAKELIQSGEIGDITVFKGTFDQDFMADPNVPFSWRMSKKDAGTGTLGDMASHTLSYALSLVGEVTEVVGQMETFIKKRNVSIGGSGHSTKGASGKQREVENDDVVQFLMRFKNNAMGIISSSRVGMGRKLEIGFEIQGTKGALMFTNERMNELNLYLSTDKDSKRGYRKIFNHPKHRWYKNFHPIAGIGLGFNDQKIIEAREMIEAIAEKRSAFPDFRFGWKINKIVDAVEKSVIEKKWQFIE